MPLYEYDCSVCARRQTLFLRRPEAEPRCETCGSKELRRLISRVAVVRGEARALAEYDPLRRLAGFDASDPRRFSRWARSVGAEVDSTLGTNFREMAERTEAGEAHPERHEAHHKLRYAVERRQDMLADPTGAAYPTFEPI
jgi:putative FmdB family regulatory protein